MAKESIRNENSPLEEKMEKALKEANIQYKSQYTVFDSTIDKWNAKYILDFLVYGEYCKIAVECDGNTYHSSQLAKENDLRRDLWVKRFGFDDTLRFNTEQINYNLKGVIKQIKEVIAAYDKIRYDKLKKNVFIVEDIPEVPSKEHVNYILKDLSEEISNICLETHQKIKVTNQKKNYIISKLRPVIFDLGFADINNTFSSFHFNHVEQYKQFIDIFFGAYNIPCSLLVVSSLKGDVIPKSLAEDSSVLKIIILYGSLNKIFEGKSYVILNGTSNSQNKIIKSDIVSYSSRNYDEERYEKLVKEATKLEKNLKKVYKQLYKMNTFRQTLVKQPFQYVEPNERSKLLMSIKHFVLVNKEREQEEAFNLAVQWVNEEAIYFKEVYFTLHDVAITIQHFRNKLVKNKKL